MASRRMFDKGIIDTDRFLDMPLSTRALYFFLGMEADDYGFVSPRRTIKIHGGSEDDIKVLIAKKFAIAFDSGVIVITDWHKHNWIDKRYVKPTEYMDEYNSLCIINKQYYLRDSEEAIRVLDNSIVHNIEHSGDSQEHHRSTTRETHEQHKSTTGDSQGKPMSNTSEPQGNSCDSPVQYSIDKLSIGNNSLDNINTSCTELSAGADPPCCKTAVTTKTKTQQTITKPAVINIPLNDKTEFPVYQSDVDEWIELYPAVDVMQELREMRDWSISNPEKRKTKKGARSFISKWLAREQDKGGRGYQRQGSSPQNTRADPFLDQARQAVANAAASINNSS